MPQRKVMPCGFGCSDRYGFAAATQASIRHCLGDLDQAVAGYAEALESRGGRRDPYARVFILIQLAAAECDAGRQRDAIGHVDAALAIARNDGFRIAAGPHDRRPASDVGAARGSGWRCRDRTLAAGGSFDLTVGDTHRWQGQNTQMPCSVRPYCP